MIAGVGFVGVVAANLATRLFERFGRQMPELARTEEERRLADIGSKLDQLDVRLKELEAISQAQGKSGS